MKPSLCLVFAGIATAYCAALPCAAQVTIDAQSTTVLLDRGLAISGISQVARRPINTDAVIAGVVDGTLDLGTVKAGDALVPGRSWSEIAAEVGSFAAPGRGAYVLIRVTSRDDRVMMLQASGHAMVYVNGQPRMGDPYSHGYVTLPIELRKGDNTLLFAHAGRGGMKAELRSSAADLVILDGDLTLPDASRTRDIEAFIGVPLANASTRSRVVTLVTDAGNGPSESAPITLAPLSVLKASTQVKIPASTQARSLVLTVRESGQTVAQHTATLNAPEIGSHYKMTFQSRVDASTQYISIVPPKASDSSDTARPALVLSLHGASVEATNQANSYAPRPGVLIACPTNRRPFGFDWEDWGRIDAIESMDEVIRRYNTDPARQYLTGHSMGGHGTWNIGALYPERFAAIAPSAGWLSFDTYTSRGGPEYAPQGPLGDIFRTARASSDTLTFFPNLRGKGVYILHGDKDDNVPVEQAREARKALDALNIPYQFHEQPGAGHWWDDDKPGAACLDWPGIWDLFAQHSLPTTPPAPAVTPPIDDRGFPRDAFKRAFDRDFVLVYSTAGTPEENAWSIAKARYDSEQWWIRGNGQAVIMSDEAFTKSPTRGNVILYGHADSTKAWKQLVGEQAAVQVTRGKAKVDGKLIEGETTAVLAALPRADVPGSEVGVITGTGLSGMRATDRLGYFGSGVGFPEVTVLESSIWKDGFTGVRGAGPKGQIVWRE